MKQSAIYFLFLLGLIQQNLFAQTADQRAENIQNGTNTIFMSADNSYYKHNSASDNDPYGYGYWVTAHTLETLADAYQRTRNTVYRDRMKSIIAGIRKYNNYARGTYRNDYYDDLEWLCLAAFNCYNATKDQEFLNAVHDIWAEIKTGYVNGAMSWKKGCTTPCKNSIANSPAIIIAVKLYQLEGDPANLQMAKDIHAWMKVNVLNDQGGIWDSPNNHNTDWQFSYNSGMFIGACLELSLVTGQQSYIDDGIKASEFMMNYRNYNGGVFFLNEKGQGDGGLFKGIFAKWFIEFVRVGNLSQIQKERYLKVINYTADYAWANAVNKSNFLVNYDWGTLPNGTIDLSTQSSGLHLFESVASLNKVHVYKDINYAGFYSQLPIGNYTLTQLQSKGISDNDITSLTVPIGYTVTVYENDNFTGASKTFTANNAWLADWNDRISSIKITDSRVFVVNAYQDINYGGYNVGLDLGNYTLAQLQSRGILNNDITSFKISPGYKITVYDGDNFTGTSKDYTADINWLDDWNDKITSLKVIDIKPYVVTVYQDVNFGGYSSGLDVGNYTLIQLQSKNILNNDITSLKVAQGYKVTAYDGDNFTGSSIDFTADNGWLADWNDKITSLKVSLITAGPNQLPSVSIISPATNASFNAPASITINANASDTDGTISKVEFYNGTTLIGTDNTTPYSVSWNNVAAGTYSITAKATDNSNGATSSSVVIIKVNPGITNQLPSVSITSPSSNASYNAPASITISASASDNDGTISKVEFFNGSNLLGSDNTSPYSFNWNNVAAGTYTITAKATDNSNGVTTSSVITIKVNVVVTNPCTSVAVYKENNGYVAGSIVQNSGSRYQCKPYPYTGWCNGAAWAYAPGIGAYWQDAWTLVGSCSSTKLAADHTSESMITPNPATDLITLTNNSNSNIEIYNSMGYLVLDKKEVEPNGSININTLTPGLYHLKIDTGSEVLIRTFIKN